MSTLLFFALAKHQKRYFSKLLAQPGIQGRVVTPAELPWPVLSALFRGIERVDWAALVEEKCQERRVKGKYAGLIYRLLLRLDLLLMALRVEALLAEECPDAVVVWNGSNRYCQVLLSLIAADTQTFYFENGLLPATTTLDARGVNYRNSVPRDAAFYRAYAKRVQVESGAEPVRLIPRKPRSAGPAPIELPASYIFIPFQDDRDTQVRLFSPWVHNMRELFELGERINRETGWSVVFKEHPSSREHYPELHLRCNEQLMFANGNSTQELIESSAFVISLNSTVGLESLLLDKPLLTLGQAFYNVEGVVVHAGAVDEMLALVRQFPGWPVEADLRGAFLHYLKHEYCVPGLWQEGSAEHLQDVSRRLLAGISPKEKECR